MNERSAFDILVDYPKKHGFKYDTHNSHKRFHLIPSDPMLNTKFVIFKKNKLFFCAYDSFGAKAYMSTTYTGLYGLINIPEEINLRITKKDWTDRFLRFNKRKTGNSFIDRNLTFTSKSRNIPFNIIKNKDVEYFLNISEKTNPLELIIECDYLQLVKELKGKMIVGVETNQWIHAESEIDNILQFGGLLLNSLQENASAQQCVISNGG